MLDSAVVDGTGDSGDREVSQQFFEDFAVALLRSLASGDYPYRVVEQFLRFLKHAQESKVPVGPVFAGAIRDLNARAFPERDSTASLGEKTEIVLASLRVLAERLVTDDAARARLSKRISDLDSAIERDILTNEERSRAHGWSYLKSLAKRLGNRPNRSVRL